MSKFLPTNCPNCAGVLVNGKCNYCGTRVMFPNTIDAISNGCIELTLNMKFGNEVQIIPLFGYISNIEFTTNDIYSYRDMDGRLARKFNLPQNVKFEFEGSLRNMEE